MDDNFLSNQWIWSELSKITADRTFSLEVNVLDYMSSYLNPFAFSIVSDSLLLQATFLQDQNLEEMVSRPVMSFGVLPVAKQIIINWPQIVKNYEHFLMDLPRSILSSECWYVYCYCTYCYCTYWCGFNMFTTGVLTCLLLEF